MIRPTQPTGTIDERLERLQKQFINSHFSILPALNKDFTFEELKKNAVETLERLEAYINNGYSDEGLWFKYGEITIIKNETI